MTIGIGRRQLIGYAAAGMGLAGTRAFARGPVRGFTHGVASGEPEADRVLLWTRFVAPSDTRLRC